jgi:hypothetical protein
MFIAFNQVELNNQDITSDRINNFVTNHIQNRKSEIKMIKIQKINFPIDCTVIHNDFYSYDPVNSFNEADSLKYLNEDLLQCSFPKEDVIIDLGWYGDNTSNKGEFRIQVIKNENWDFPFNIIYSKYAEEIKDLLIKILLYYTSIDFVKEPNNV